MMNNRVTRIIANTVGLAAVAALGITVYQLGTSPIKEEAPKEQTQDTAQSENTDDIFAGEDGISQTESESQPSLEEENQDDVEMTSVDGNTLVNPNGDMNENTVDKNKAEVSVNVDKSSDVNSTDGESADVEDTDAGEATDVSASAINLPTVNFSEDTLMEWPVNGNILLDYSMDQTTYFPTLDQYRLNPAIAVGAVEGAPVVAAVNGTVYSVEQDAQTGTTVTMELGNGYQAVYGQLTDLTVSEGDTVKKGTTIGYIAQPTKYYSTEGTNLYFEMKKDGEPIDPIAYLP
ncbi:MAG: M23 family metallopeptidase [Blautia sp.]|uniref:M23 family metallopeptidase n=1 Tax=Blautia sp. TaxID=1955243 RepID=UPI0025BABC68|nr:M23 family metallopeptidase [Blautia sp.]MCI6302321.1 M23 family metallopeptidase [Blautia sp.]